MLLNMISHNMANPVVAPEIGPAGALATPLWLRVEDLTLAYEGHPAVHHLCAQFQGGVCTAILGPNGAGKSTLLQALAGQRAPNHGRVFFSGCTLEDVGYLPQRAMVDVSFPISVEEFVRLQKTRGGKAPAAAAAQQALAMMGLGDFGRRWIGGLSAGQFQRMLFARLMLSDARLLLLDEPFTALDAPSCERLWQVMSGWRQEGRLVLIVLHDIEAALTHCAQTLLLARETIAFGESEAVLSASNLHRAWKLAEGWASDAPVCAR